MKRKARSSSAAEESSPVAPFEAQLPSAEGPPGLFADESASLVRETALSARPTPRRIVRRGRTPQTSPPPPAPKMAAPSPPEIPSPKEGDPSAESVDEATAQRSETQRPALDPEVWRARGAVPTEIWGMPEVGETPTWTLEEVRGRLLELAAVGASARDTLAFSLIVEAQSRGEPVAWIGCRGSCFFPPDAARAGADLDALVVVLLSRGEDLGRAAELLIRSGAFGLLVLDLGLEIWAVASQARMAGWAKQHGTTVLALTDKGPGQPSLGPLIALRGEVHRRELGPGRWQCVLEVAKDRRRGRSWQHEEVHGGPPGLS